MRRLRPSVVLLSLFTVIGMACQSQESAFVSKASTGQLVESVDKTVSISNNAQLERIMITCNEPMQGEIELTISDVNGKLVHNTKINSSNSKLITYPSAMLDTSVYKVSCTINDEVWEQLVQID